MLSYLVTIYPFLTYIKSVSEKHNYVDQRSAPRVVCFISLHFQSGQFRLLGKRLKSNNVTWGTIKLEVCISASGPGKAEAEL